MPTTGSRLLAVTPSFSLVCLTRMPFSRLAGFSGTAPGSFPNSSITPFRIAISMSSSLFSRRCRSTSASSSSRRARVSASLFSSAATASARPAASRGPAAAGGMAAGVEGSTPVFPSPAVGASLQVSSSRASPWIRRASAVSSFPTTDASTPSSAAASRDSGRPDATATTAFRFNSSGTGPCLSLRRPGASSSIHAVSSSWLFG